MQPCPPRRCNVARSVAHVTGTQRPDGAQSYISNGSTPLTEVPFSIAPPNYYLSDAARGRKAFINLQDLISPTREVNRQRLAEKINRNDGYLPTVVKHRGKYHIHEGLEELTADHFSGRREVEVNLIDLGGHP